MNDKNINTDITTKGILKKAMLKTPSSDFSNRVMDEVMAENITEKYSQLKKRWGLSLVVLITTLFIYIIISNLFINFGFGAVSVYESINANLNQILSVSNSIHVDIHNFLVFLNIMITFCFLYIIDLLYQKVRNINYQYNKNSNS